jgi:CHASE2 domain-containing sensor protein
MPIEKGSERARYLRERLCSFRSSIARVLRTGWSRLARAWGRASRFQRNVVFGLCFLGLVHLLHDTRLVGAVEDAALDVMNSLQVDTACLNPGPPGQRSGWCDTLAWLGWSPGPRSSESGYVLLDMDEAAYTKWNEPFHVPRDQLASLIRYAGRNHAALIIVDVDLSRPGADPGADEALRRMLLELPEAFPKLLLVRTQKPHWQNAGALPVWRRTLLHGEPLPTQVHWVYPHFLEDPGDHRVRRWRLVDPGCFEGRPRWAPSPQLMADILLSAKPQGWKELQAQLEQGTALDCAEAANTGAPGPERLKYLGAPGPRALALAPDGLDQRVIYSYRWPEPERRRAHDFGSPVCCTIRHSDRGSANGQREDDFGERSATGLTILKALDVLQDTEDRFGHLLQGRIVVIGASYADSHDLHATPVGEMPGALVILNAVKSLRQFGPLHALDAWTTRVVQLVLVLVISYVFAHLDSLRATLVVNLGVIAIGGVASFFLFQTGVWIEVAVPVLGVQAYNLWDDIREMREMREANARSSASA